EGQRGGVELGEFIVRNFAEEAQAGLIGKGGTVFAAASGKGEAGAVAVADGTPGVDEHREIFARLERDGVEAEGSDGRFRGRWAEVGGGGERRGDDAIGMEVEEVDRLAAHGFAVGEDYGGEAESDE